MERHFDPDHRTDWPAAASASKGIWPLLALNFFMADMQSGIGPFLGVFLLAHGWQSGLIGTVMTVGGVAGMLMTTPAGALIDATRHKKLYVIIPGICTRDRLRHRSAIAKFLAGDAVAGRDRDRRRRRSDRRWPASRSALFVRPASTGRIGHNQAFNHAGNMVGAGLSGLLGWMFGFPAVLWLAALLRRAVDRLGADDPERRDRRRRGARPRPASKNRTRPRSAGSRCCSRIQAAVDPGRGAGLFSSRQWRDACRSTGLRWSRPSRAIRRGFVATTIVVAQGTMMLVSLIAMRLGGEGRLLAGAADLVHRAADPRRDRRLCHQQLGRVSRADPRRRRRRPAERGVPGAGRAYPPWHRAGQCRSGRGDDGAGSGRGAQPGDRRLDRAGDRLQRDVSHSRQFCAGLDRACGSALLRSF